MASVAKIDGSGNARLNIDKSGSCFVVVSDETKLIGDFNNDAICDVYNVMILLKNILENTPVPASPKMDLNGDGVVY